MNLRFVSRGRIGCAVVAGVFAMAVNAVQAQTILMDFGATGGFRGLSVSNPDSNGNFWNSTIPGQFNVNLIDTTNSATTIDLGFSTPVGTDSFNGPAGPTDSVTLATDVLNTDIDAGALGLLGGALEAAFDFAAGAPGAVRFEIQELDPTKTYNLTFFGSHKFSDSATTVYSVFTDNTYTTLVDSASLNVQDPGDPSLHNRDTVATISGLSPQASNILYIEFAAITGGTGYLNALQIDVVPEPSSILMLAVGGLMVIRRKR